MSKILQKKQSFKIEKCLGKGEKLLLVEKEHDTN
jgi:hypothetical protein